MLNKALVAASERGPAFQNRLLDVPFARHPPSISILPRSARPWRRVLIWSRLRAAIAAAGVDHRPQTRFEGPVNCVGRSFGASNLCCVCMAQCPCALRCCDHGDALIPRSERCPTLLDEAGRQILVPVSLTTPFCEVRSAHVSPCGVPWWSRLSTPCRFHSPRI